MTSAANQSADLTPYADSALARGWELLRDVAGTEAEVVAAHTAVAFFTPACVAVGRVSTGLRHAARAGFRLRHLARVLLDGDQVHQIWQPQSAGFAPDRWAVATDLFCAGPGVVAVVTTLTSTTGSAAEEFKALQGPSSPGQLQPGHLRRKLGAVNKINNLVHVSADTPATVRELTIMLGRPAARFAWQAVVDRRAVRRPDVELARQLGSERDAAAGLGVVVSRLRWRAFLLGRTIAAPPAGLEAVLAELADRARADPAGGFPATGAWRAGDGRREFAADFAGWLGEPAPLVAAISALDDLSVGRSRGAGDVRRAVLAAGLQPSGWELLALTTAAASRDIEP
jgi:hypothetical protein